MQEGRHVARVIQDRLAGRHSVPFHYRDRGNLATVGRKYAIGEFGRMRLRGFLAWVAWTFIHVYYLIGFRNRVIVLLEWAWAYVTYQRGARIILKPADESSRGVPAQAASERNGHGRKFGHGT
jgi:NADH dehydrogenase